MAKRAQESAPKKWTFWFEDDLRNVSRLHQSPNFFDYTRDVRQIFLITVNQLDDFSCVRLNHHLMVELLRVSEMLRGIWCSPSIIAIDSSKLISILLVFFFPAPIREPSESQIIQPTPPTLEQIHLPLLAFRRLPAPNNDLFLFFIQP